MTTPAPHLTDPHTPLVALEGGPKHRRWFFYTDWLATREASRRGRYPIHHPCSSERCYLPTGRTATNPNPAITDRHGPARIWTYVHPDQCTRIWDHVHPDQWTRWGREYLTPEEVAAHDRRRAAA
ncbi:hypothetical protein ACQPZF_00925 [Actinosynnema sp. CS-041913]|uniref:hypothetical protein n=1 Tax=Actinosynnema sp. CS-041913 TaxID=3239917 RepID=UPI003D946AF5